MIRSVLAMVAFVIVLGIVGQCDYKDAKRDEAVYCAGVADGSWPDYKGVANVACKQPLADAGKL